MANKRKSGKRYRNGRLKGPTTRAERKLKSEEAGRTEPSERIQALRALFRGNVIREGRDVRDDIHDGIGQLHALDFLDGHGIEPDHLRDAGRRYAQLYWGRNGATAPAGQRLERGDRSKESYRITSDDLRYDACSDALATMPYERGVLELLCCDYWFSDAIAPFAFRLVTTELLKRGKRCPVVELSTAHDFDVLGALVRALCAVHNALLPGRYQRLAA
jgi:hypothetical protein